MQLTLSIQNYIIILTRLMVNNLFLQQLKVKNEIISLLETTAYSVLALFIFITI